MTAEDDKAGDYDAAARPALAATSAATRNLLEREIGDRRRRDGRARFLPALFELDENADLSTFLAGEGLDGRWREGLIVPRMFERLERLTGVLPFVVAYASVDALEAWLDGDFLDVTPRLELARPFRAIGDEVAARDAARLLAIPPETDGKSGSGTDDARFASLFVEGAPASPSPERPTVTAIIDDGMAVALDRFRTGTATRISHLLVQEAGNGIGRELRSGGADGLDALLARHDHAGIVDEDAVYREAGLLDFLEPDRALLGRGATHGAAIMDLAAGHPHGSGPAADEAPIICVQLPASSVRDTSLEGMEVQVVLAIVYVLLSSLRHARDGRPPAVVINLSFANTAGPHDGTGPIERQVDRLVRLWRRVAPVQFVTAAGNHRLSGLNAKLPLESGAVRTLPWRIPPDDGTHNTMQLWLDAPLTGTASSPRLRARLVAPGGAGMSGWVEDGSPAVSEVVIGGHAVARLTAAAPSPLGRSSFAVETNPTIETDDGLHAVAPSGRWFVEIEALADVEVDARIQRDDRSIGHRARGRQSWFDHPSNVRFDDDAPRFAADGTLIDEDDIDAVVRREGTLSAIATGCEPVVVGGHVTAQARVARYSGEGPVQTPPCPGGPDRTGVDVFAESDRSVVRRGVITAGARSGARRAWSGTSVAAPRITRAIAGSVDTLPDRAAVRSGNLEPASEEIA